MHGTKNKIGTEMLPNVTTVTGFEGGQVHFED
jgi:hypothetical protein